MSLFDCLQSDLKQAMKARDFFRVGVLRMIIAACNNYRIAKYGGTDHTLSDDDVISVLTQQIKQRKESAARYADVGRSDFAEKEHQEAHLLHTYMPPQLSEAELLEVIRTTRDSLQLSRPSDIGKLIRAVMDKVHGRADGSLVSELVKREFSL